MLSVRVLWWYLKALLDYAQKISFRCTMEQHEMVFKLIKYSIMIHSCCLSTRQTLTSDFNFKNVLDNTIVVSRFISWSVYVVHDPIPEIRSIINWVDPTVQHFVAIIIRVNIIHVVSCSENQFSCMLYIVNLCYLFQLHNNFMVVSKHRQLLKSKVLWCTYLIELVH